MFPPNFWIEESEKFYRDTENIILALFMRGAILGEDALKPSGVNTLMDWDIVNVRALQYLQTVNKDIFKYINETTQKQVNPIIMEWLRAGESMPKLIKRLMDVAYPKHRAEMIAVTEVTRAVSAGNLTAWQSTSYVTGKQWTTAKDERVCPICGKLDGKISDIEVDFVLDMSDTTGEDDPLAKFHQKHGGQMTTMTPPAHPRCRCSMRPIVDAEAFRDRPLVNYD
jgi:SPP1 gp7 family putative phage head morphogenesis protein